MIYKCKCGVKELCAAHRPPERHECIFDYKSIKAKQFEPVIAPRCVKI
jgi:predicted nucleic acid binding AN1-type Zn finger protein